MGRVQSWKDGRRNGIKWAITYLHRRANEMNDPHAKAVLDVAAFSLGVAAKKPKNSAEAMRKKAGA